MPIKFNLCDFVNPVFIETGGYQGAGIKKALNAGFAKVHSIEIVPRLAARLTTWAAQFHGRVEIWEGNSSTVLPTVLADASVVDKRCTFWLDAHCYGPDVEAHVPCPLYAELTAIAAHALKTHTILIDDRRLFSHYGVDETVLRQQILAINSRYCFSYLKGYRPSDVLAAYIV